MELKTIFWLIALAWFINKLRIWIRFFIKLRKNSEKEKQAKQLRENKKYKFDSVDKAIKKSILDCNISGLLKGQFDGKFTSRQIISVFADRWFRIGRDLNLTADEWFDSALLLADQKDKELQQIKSLGKDPYLELGKLHGIPFSVKDHIRLKGYLNTGGVGSRADFKDTYDSNYIAALKEEGGIPLVKGNVPIICLSIHSTNNIWGWGKNPWNHERSIGGSSGGEGGLLASNCIPIGIGSDLGGSLRVPAVFNGVYCFNPSGSRQSGHGVYHYFQEMEFRPAPMPGTIGPMSRDLDDLTRLMRVYYSEKMFKKEKIYPAIEFNMSLYDQTVNSKKLRIGIIKDYEPAMGMCTAMKRALEETQEHLRSLGHEVIEIEIPNVEDHITNHIQIFLNEFGPHLGPNWNEHWDNLGGLTGLLLLHKAPKCISKGLAFLLRLFKQHRLSQIIETAPQTSLDEFTELVKIRAHHWDIINNIWTTNGLDAMINAPLPFPAFKSADADKVGMSPIGARLSIYWQFPSGTFPVTLVQEGEDVFEEKLYNDFFTTHISSTIKGSVGMPVGLEIIAAPFKDEKALAVMKILEGKIKFHEKHKYPNYD